MRDAATLSLILAVVLGCSAGERQVRTYDTIDAARSDALFTRGWVPDVLPTGSGPIVEAHDLDTNGRCSRSVFPSGGSSAVTEALAGRGFEPFRGDLPSLPLSICPFSFSDIPQAAPVLRLLSEKSEKAEIAVVANDVLFIWSARK